MNFDIRIPIGLLFGLLGLILAGFGLYTGSNHVIYAKSIHTNFNLIWGIVMVVFASVMLWLAYRARKQSKTSDQSK